MKNHRTRHVVHDDLPGWKTVCGAKLTAGRASIRGYRLYTSRALAFGPNVLRRSVAIRFLMISPPA